MNKPLHYQDIPKFTGNPRYTVSISWFMLEHTIEQYHIDLDPDFQRGHVWTPEQQRAFIEFRLSGGMSGSEIMLNNPVRDWPHGDQDISVVVDGKQRITAVRSFMRNELKVFGGHFQRDIEGFPRLDRSVMFTLHINDLKTRAEVLRWYLELNTGGVIHTTEELARVHALLMAEEG